MGGDDEVMGAALVPCALSVRQQLCMVGSGGWRVVEDGDRCGNRLPHQQAIPGALRGVGELDPLTELRSGDGCDG